MSQGPTNSPNISFQDELPFMSIAPSKLFAGRIALYPWEVARALGCTKPQVLNLIEIGKLAAIDIGSTKPKRVRKGKHCSAVRRFWRVPVSALEAFIAKNNSYALTGAEH